MVHVVVFEFSSEILANNPGKRRERAPADKRPALRPSRSLGPQRGCMAWGTQLRPPPPRPPRPPSLTQPMDLAGAGLGDDGGRQRAPCIVNSTHPWKHECPAMAPRLVVGLHRRQLAWAARKRTAPDVEAVPSEAERAGGGASAGSCPSHRLTLSMMRMRSCTARHGAHVHPKPDPTGTEAGKP